MHFQIRIIGIGLTGEQRLQLAPSGFRPQLAQRLLGFGNDLLIGLGLAQFDHHFLIGDILLDAADGGELIFERGALLHHLAGALGIVPKIGMLGLAIELGEARLRLVEVKDASSAVRPTA
jgi:hypothetical protein